MPEVLVTPEIVWRDIGRHRPRGRTSYSNDALRKFLLPDGLTWLVTQLRPTRHDPIPLDPSLAEIISRKYGLLREGLTLEFTEEEWALGNITDLRFEDSLVLGEWLLVPPARPPRTITPETWASFSPKLGLRWEVSTDKPTMGTEIKHDGLRALLLESLDLSERNLDDLDGLSLHPDSFVSLLPDGLLLTLCLQISSREPRAHGPPLLGILGKTGQAKRPNWTMW